MFEGFKRRHQLRREREDECMLMRIYTRGFQARLSGLLCRPPEGYEAAIALDLVGWWTAGWEEADRLMVGSGAGARTASGLVDG
jgi:hypothetical protein